jgi:DNA-binding NtrC family response regulator
MGKSNDGRITSDLIVLIVISDLLLADLVGKAVKEVGCATIKATNAVQALILLEEGLDVGFVVADLQLSGSISGAQLSAVISHRWPKIHLIAAGRLDEIRNASLPGSCLTIVKPYHLEDLIELIQVGMPKCSIRL